MNLFFETKKMPVRFALIAMICLSLFAVLPVGSAKADLRVCNQTDNPVAIAIGFKAENGWQSEGWWIAEKEACALVFNGPLNEQPSQYFYLHAVDDVSGGVWGGRIYMCTRDKAFTIFGEKDCLARGYERTGFMEVDTENNTDWTVQLTETDLQPLETQ
ncbi:DUF1036 domain-containing protein [Maritalea mediterranea]|uniref:DUF1036 domain-containing protein n=1 Tax=Maritalea mediterranea TaxID=2909667 RepID=UPI003F727DFF